jgi:fatty-acid desaturase
MKKYTTFSGKMMSRIQYATLASAIVGAFFVTWTPAMIFTLLVFFYLYGIIGMGMMMHRYWSHKSFEFKSVILQKLFTAIAVVSARGSPLAWVHIHREHHAYADTEKDPHKPGKFALFSFKTTYIAQLKIFLIKDMLTDEQKFIHEYYLLLLLAWIVLLFLINPALLYFAWILPVCLNQVSQDLWNYFSHVNTGYRNFETKDNSRNIVWLWPLIMGETWHNNHHNNPKLQTTKVKKYELDPVDTLINLVKK